VKLAVFCEREKETSAEVEQSQILYAKVIMKSLLPIFILHQCYIRVTESDPGVLVETGFLK